MRRVISISLGSSERDHAVEVKILGQTFRIERIGTDGDRSRAIELIKSLDGQVDAFGMGGIDLYISAGSRRYTIREAVPIARAAVKSPIVDGSGLKNTLERKVVRHLASHHPRVGLSGKRVLLVSGVDRFGMAEALVEAGSQVTFGDLIFILGIPIPLRSLKALDLVARVVAPIACQLPFNMLYPTGDKQTQVTPKYHRYYHEAEMLAGDFHLIRRFMPDNLTGKTILTNTVTPADVGELRRRGAKLLITTTPELNGRSFGTNVIEAVLVALAGKPWNQMTPDDYDVLLDKIGFVPRIEHLTDQASAV